MPEKETKELGLINGIGGGFGRTALAVTGLALMVVGVAMGVTVVMLPIGIGVGFAGAALLAGAVMARPEPR